MKSLRLLLLAALLAPAFAAEPVIKPGSNLVVEGVPDIPTSLARDLRRYTESRAASFAGWHPTRKEMLMSTRFGNTAQIHQLGTPLGMRRQLTFFDEPVVSAGMDRLAGDFFLFSRDQGGSEFAQLYRYDFKDGNVTLLTDGGRSQNGGVNWSSKGDRIAYASTRRNGADRDLYVMNPRDPSSDRLLVKLNGGGWGVADWSPDDQQLLVVEYVSINESHLWLVSIADGAMRELTPRAEKGISYGDAAFSKDGRAVYLTTDKEFEYRRLARLDLASGKIEYLSSSILHDVDGLSISEDGTRLLFITNELGIDRAYLMDTATAKYRRIECIPAGLIGGGAWHKDGKHIAFTLSSARSTADIHVYDVQADSLTRWTESELGGIVANELREPELIRWKSFDGLEISGFYYRPASRFEGKRPVIVNIHGGPEGQSLPTFQGRNNYLLNELGVALIYPNVRGSVGFGKTFVTLDNGFKREDSVKDIGALLDWIAGQPELDADRVMITGGSYGGYMTLASAVHYSDRIRCAVDVVGISNFVTFLKNTEDYRRDLRRVEYGDERDPAMHEFLMRISPNMSASKIKKPLFVIQGANDPRVPRSEAIQMVETLRTNGGVVWYLEAKDEGHGFRKKANSDFQFYATLEFIRLHLLK